MIQLRARIQSALTAGLAVSLSASWWPARQVAAQVAPPPAIEPSPAEGAPPAGPGEGPPLRSPAEGAPPAGPGEGPPLRSPAEGAAPAGPGEGPPPRAELAPPGAPQPGAASPPGSGAPGALPEPVEQQMAPPAEPPASAATPPLVSPKPAPVPVQPPLRVPAIPRVSYEWQRTSRLLAQEGLELEPSPQGKRIAFVRIVRDDVFVEDELWPTWLNWFHGRTRESVVRRELLFEAGAAYDEERIEETMRNLRGMAIFSLVRIVPIQTGRPGEVGVLVHTRDLWSLRFEQDFSATGRTLNTLLLRGTELNAFGRNKTVSADLTILPKSYTVAQSYYARRVLGSSYALSQRAGLVFNRATDTIEGNVWSLRFGQPFYYLKQRYAWLASYERDDRVIRAVQDNTVLTFPRQRGYPGPYTDWQYRRALDKGSLFGEIRIGERVKQTFSAGWDYRNQEARSIAVPVELEESFALQVLPKQRRESGPALGYELFTPTYVTFENLSTYGKSENVRVGPSVVLSTRLPLEALGSSTDSWVLAGDLGWTLAPRGALIDMRAATSGRYERGQFVDRRTIFLLRGASPTFSVLRLVGSISFDLRHRDTQNTFVTLGGDYGLRGYPSQAFNAFGAHRAAANFELRTLPVQWRAVQLGAVLFYDVGSVFRSLDDFQLHHAVGIGARLLFPQFNRYPFTFDAGMSFDPAFRLVPTLMGGQFVPITAAEDPT